MTANVKSSTETGAAGSGSDKAKGGLAFLYRIAQTGLTASDWPAAAEDFLEMTGSYLGADRGYILMAAPHGDSAEILVSWGRFSQSASPGRVAQSAEVQAPAVSVSDNLVKRVLGSDSAVLVADAMTDEGLYADPAFQRFNVHAAMCAPVETGGESKGLLYIDCSRVEHNWNEQDIELFKFIANYLGFVAQLANLRQEKEENERFVTAARVTLNVSHSVKNILQLISGAGEVLDFGLKTNEIHRVKRSWNILKPNLERIRRFTLDMLDFSRERPVKAGPCEFNRTIQSAVESLQIHLKQKQAKLHIRVDQRIGVIELDTDRIHQMAANLILNAIDVVDPQSGQVMVATTLPADANEVLLTITDNAPALSEEEKEQVFEPLQSVRNKTGTGLGLAVAKKTVQQHGGRIEIESTPDKGNTIKVFLPAKPATTAAGQQK